MQISPKCVEFNQIGHSIGNSKCSKAHMESEAEAKAKRRLNKALVAAGVFEIIAGSLLFIVPLPPVQVLAGSIVLDGLRRVAEKGAAVSEQILAKKDQKKIR